MFMKQEILIVWPQNIANMFIKCEIIIVWSQNIGNMFVKQEIIGFLEAGLSFWKIAFEIGLHAKKGRFFIIYHCIRSQLTYSVLTLTPVKMWLAPQVCNKTVHLITPAVLKKLNISSSSSKQKMVYHCLFRDPWFYFGALLFHYLYAKLRLGLIHDLLGFHFL